MFFTKLLNMFFFIIFFAPSSFKVLKPAQTRFVLYEIQVEMPGFVGHSLLVHQMGNQTIGFNLMLSFRTSTSDGLLFYTGKNVFRAK